MFTYENQNRKNKKAVKSISKAQRASCHIRIFRWHDPNIANLIHTNASNNFASSANLANLKNVANNIIQAQLNKDLHIKSDIIRCSINKNKTGSSGSFSVTLKQGNQIKGGTVLSNSINYLESINQGDWIAIFIKKSGEIDTSKLTSEAGLKMIGIVENIRYIEVDDPERGIPRLEYIVTGRDFGKVFDMDIFFNPIINSQTIQNILGQTFLSDSSKSIKELGLSPDQAVRQLVSFYLGGELQKKNQNNQLWYIPVSLSNAFAGKTNYTSGGVSFVNILNTSQIGLHNYQRGSLRSVSTLPGRAIIKSLPSNGTVWSILQHLQNPGFNELYTELIPDDRGTLTPALIMRQVPFSNYPKHKTDIFSLAQQPNPLSANEVTYFLDLPRITINSTDIKQKNIGKSDHERINHVIVVPQIDKEGFDLAYVSGLNALSVQRYGLRSLQLQTQYIFSQDVTNQISQGIQEYLKKCVYLIEDWFFAAHNLYNGTIIVDGINQHVAVGKNLFIQDVRQLFHIESYTHNYEIFSSGQILYNTEFRVSRGQYESKTGIANFIENSSEKISVSVSSLDTTHVDKRNKI